MILIGLTGGVGMGKSAAASYLAGRGVPVADTDQIAREVVAPGQPALAEISAAFGSEFLGTDGQLLRSALGKVVFADPAARAKLEAILHPKIRVRWQAQASQWRDERRPAGVVVIPLLYETDAQAEVDRVICVACREATQQQRLAARGWQPDEIARRCAAQWPIEKKMAQANFVVWNEGSLAVLQAQLNQILAGLNI